MNGEEFTKEGNTLLHSARIARRMAQAGVDYISVSAGERFEDAEPPPEGFPPFAGSGYSGYRMSPRWWNPDGVHVFLAEGVRKAVRKAGYDIPIVTAGKIRMPALAEEVLSQNRADIIGMARTLLADPDWPIKAREGRDDDIVKCAACGYCSEADERYEAVTCIQWPKGIVNAPSPWLLVPPCQGACPAGLNIREYVELITQGEYEKALKVIEEENSTCLVPSAACARGFVKPTCNRGSLDEPDCDKRAQALCGGCDSVETGYSHQSTPLPRTRKENSCHNRLRPSRPDRCRQPGAARVWHHYLRGKHLFPEACWR